MNRYYLYLLLSPLLITLACKKAVNDSTPDPIVPVIPVTPVFAKGADVSWLTQMEAAGIKFYDSSGTERECMQLLKNAGINAVRLRVWVNPVNGWNGTADVVAKALRAKNLGMDIMIDFHYSDSWADPGQQTKPAAWAGQDFAALKTSVYNHTYAVMNTLKTNGISPKWVQVGNETNDGMLWPEGKASVNMSNYAAFFISGYNAVKDVSPGSKVMVHISNGFDNGLFRWNLDGLKANGADWDITAMSLYPDAINWASFNNQCLTNMNDMVTRFNKDVMVCEVGMSWTDSSACRAFISDLLAKTRAVTGNRGLGVFYWEPQAYNNWQGYTKGIFNNAGRPTTALKAFN